MPIAMRLDFYISNGPSGERPTVGDLRRWLEIVEKQGVSDTENLEIIRDDHDEIEGFSTWANPA